MTNGVYLLLGSNLGNRKVHLSKTIKLIEKSIGKISKFSSVYETAAWGKLNQPAFLNQVIVVDTKVSPDCLLSELQRIEKLIGRIRKEKWGERTIDVDILYYNDIIIETDYLSIPHPEIQHRRFTLEPLTEIAPEFHHPVLNRSNLDLLTECKDLLTVRKMA